MKSVSRALVVLCLALLAPAMVGAQGLLVVTEPGQSGRLPRPIIIWPGPQPPIVRPEPRPVGSYKIKELDIQARLADQVAQVQMSQSFVNTGSTQLEVSFVFPLPYDGAINQMTLLVDGKEYPAKLLGAEDARRLYEDIVRKNRDPALLEWMGTGLFRTSVFPVPPGQSRTVNIRYTQLLRKQDGMTDFLLPLSTARYTSEAVEKVGIRATIESGEEIKNVYSPTHAVKIDRPDGKHATVTFTAQREIPTTDFRLLYDVGAGKVSARVVSYRPSDSDDGYFLLLASPEIKSQGKEPPKKTVIFTLDRSGSMSGKKIEQVRSALKFVLQNLRQGDLFNIVAYDSSVESFRPELQRFDDQTRAAALGFVEGIYAGGSTNIDAALRTSLSQLTDTGRPSYVLFLTDGLPTTGITGESEIVKNSKDVNKVHARVFPFGVGYDVNARLLDKVARENFGQSEYVRPDQDIEEYVARLYRRIESPVMTGVQLEFAFDQVKTEEGNPINRVYPKDSIDLFAGEQLVIVGRYRKPGAAKVILRGSVEGQEQKLDFPAELSAKSADESNAFIEKLWAVRRVGEIIDEIDLKGKNEELVRELVELSKKHGILTPYTSFFADDTASLHDLAGNARRASDRLMALDEVQGPSGVHQRAFKGSLQRAEQANSPPAAMPAAPAFDHFAQDARAGRTLRAKSSPGGMGGMGGGMGGVAGAAAPAEAGLAADSAREAKPVKETIRNVANRTFYLRSGQWVDSTATPEQERTATRVRQFTPEYFDLARKHGRKLSQYLVFDEPVLITLDSQAYLIEP